MSREDRIQSLLQALEPLQLIIENESKMHSGPREDSHYKVLIISEKFQDESRVSRQRKVNQLLQSEFEAGMHALSLRCLTPVEAESQGVEFKSPDCASSSLPTDT